MRCAHLPLVRRQPAQRALLAFAKRDPVLDAVVLERVQQVLALKGQVAFEDEHRLAVAEDWNLADR